MTKFQLIPHQIDDILEETNEIPEGVEMIGAPNQWEEDTYGSDTVIAVIDTGCDVNHPDLRDSIIGGRNFSGGNPRNILDQNGHGTHVAGTIAASLNGHGVAGVAPKAKLLILKVMDDKGTTTYQNLVKAIRYATRWRGPNKEKVDVISMSLGGQKDYASLHRSIKNAVKEDILVVCAAGNSGDGNARTPERLYPGYYDEVVQVGAVDFDAKMAEFTNTNDEIDLVAPGVGVRSTYLDGKYAKLSGTSMATPHVTGAAALLIDQHRQEDIELTEDELFDALTEHTKDLGYTREVEGNGMIYFKDIFE